MPSPAIAISGADGSAASGASLNHHHHDEKQMLTCAEAADSSRNNMLILTATSSSSYTSTTTSNTMTPKSVIVAPAGTKVSSDNRITSNSAKDMPVGQDNRRNNSKRSYWRRRNRKRKVFFNRNNNRTRPYTTPLRDWDMSQPRVCPIQEKPFAPDNTTQFLMEDHNVREPEFEEIRKLLRMHQEHEDQECDRVKSDSADQQAADSFETRDGSDSDDFYSSPDDEQDFQQRQFSEVYDHVHTERLSSMNKTDLVQEYILLEEKAEDMEKKLRVTQAMLTEIKHRTGTATPPVSSVMSVLDIARLKAEIKRLTEENDRLRYASHATSHPPSSSNSSTTTTTTTAAAAAADADDDIVVADSSSTNMDTNAIPSSSSPVVTS